MLQGNLKIMWMEIVRQCWSLKTLIYPIWTIKEKSLTGEAVTL